MIKYNRSNIITAAVLNSRALRAASAKPIHNFTTTVVGQRGFYREICNFVLFYCCYSYRSSSLYVVVGNHHLSRKDPGEKMLRVRQLILVSSSSAKAHELNLKTVIIN